MNTLYLTADKLGIETGGGVVTFNESEALRSISDCEVMDGNMLPAGTHNPFDQDAWFAGQIMTNAVPKNYYGQLNLAHCYAGCLSESVEELQCMGVRVSYTAAAHDITVSRREHEALGLSYNYPHLTDPKLWERYLAGYKMADCLVCPSQHSAKVMRDFDCTNEIKVIPHGINMPECIACAGVGWWGTDATSRKETCGTCNGTGIEPIAPLPYQFVAGYLGVCGGPDKGLRYLLEAWKMLGYKDALLKLAGRDSASSFVYNLIHRFGGGNIELTGWVNDPHDFYSSISLYVQPSSSEGWGLEVTEAMANGRMVLCSDGAGAADAVPHGHRFQACNAKELAEKIDAVKKEGRDRLEQAGKVAAIAAREYDWKIICAKYADLWQSLVRN